MSDATPPRRHGGIEGKWASMHDERETLRRERDQLREQVAQLLSEKAGAQALKEHGLELDETESEAWEALRFVYQRVGHDWGLHANQAELVSAVHVLQSFIIQHMLARLSPDQWGGWWTDPEKPPEKKEEEHHGHGASEFLHHVARGG